MPATWGKNTLTNQALTMMNQALGISAITFTKAVTITDDITGDSVSQLQALTSVNYKQSRTPKAIATQDNKSRLGVTIDNSDVNEDYIYYGVGIYAKQNSTNQEVLFSVIPLTAGATMIAKENNATTASIYLDLYTDIVRGTQVTIMVSNSGTLSREDVQQMISQSIGNALNYPNETASKGTDFNTILDISITRIIKDTTVVNAPSGFSGTGYLTTIGSGDKTVPIMQTLDDTINNIRSTRYFNSTTNVWSEWNAYAKTVDVNQQLDKKVNVTDMRKPANTVAGIEEVNVKQDKIAYTPADDSKVVHNSGNETIGDTKTFTNPIKGTIDGIAYRYSAQGDDLDTSYMNDSVIFTGNNKVVHAPAGTAGTWAIVRNYNSNATNGAQSYYDTNNGELYFRTRNNNTEYSPWIQVADDSKVVHSTDMRKPASDVAGIEEVNAKQDKIAYIPADDSKVAHLSGANNFDTVPTVNNNPLLLASSLPSDLARTGQSQTFTAAQTFSIAPVINDASTDKGDNQAATMADLKSVEKSAWLAIPDDKIDFKVVEGQTSSNVHLAGSNCMYKVKPDEGRIYLAGGVLVKGANNGTTISYNLNFDFSDITSKILVPYDTGFMQGPDTRAIYGSVINNTTLNFQINYRNDEMMGFINYHDFPYINCTPKS